MDASSPGVGAGDVLAGRASDDDFWEKAQISAKSGCRDPSNVVIKVNPRIVLCVNRPSPRNLLRRGDGFEARTMQSERPAACGRAEQVQDAVLSH